MTPSSAPEVLPAELNRSLCFGGEHRSHVVQAHMIGMS